MSSCLLLDGHLSIRLVTTFNCLWPVKPFMLRSLIVANSFSSNSSEWCGLLCGRIDLSNAIVVNVGILFSQVEPNSRNLILVAIQKENSIILILVQRQLWFGTTLSIEIILPVAKFVPRIEAILFFWAIAVLGSTVAYIMIKFNYVHKEVVCIFFTIKVGSSKSDK
jgi:hypothetical protein